MSVLRFTPKQREAYLVANKNLITLYGGAIRGGKSYWLLYTFIVYCFKYPKSRWLIVRESMPTMKRTILPTFQTKFVDVGLMAYIKEFNQQTMTVTFNNGSEILFMSENFDTDKELNRFRGLEINGAGADEVNELHKETFYKLIERSGSWIGSPGCPIKILLTCNPTQGWVKELFYKQWINNTLPKGWAYVPAHITDNPYVDKNYLESLKTMPPDNYKIFVEGDWNVSAEGTLFKQSDLIRFKAEDLPKEADGKIAYADVADEGTDFYSMPMGYVSGKLIYITEVIFTQDNVDVTIPRSADLIKRHKPDNVWIETNNQGSVFIKMLRKEIDDPGIITPDISSASKTTRIILSYYYVKKYFRFLDQSEYEPDSDYGKFMQNMFDFMKDGSAPHDDAPDSISGMVKKLQIELPDFFEQYIEPEPKKELPPHISY